MITEQHLNLLRQIAAQAQANDQDIGLSANVVVELLNEVVRLRSERDQWERRARELESLCADRL